MPRGTTTESLSIAQRFQQLAAKWQEDTALLSSMTRMAMHPAYQQIIGMGPDAVPLLLRQLEKEPDHWFWALKSITGIDPTPPADRGNLKKMAEAWLSWGREKGYQW